MISDVLGALGSAASRVLNVALFGGEISQSISARAYVESFTAPVWARRRVLIDRAFLHLPAYVGGGPDHCRRMWDWEIDRALEALQRNGLIPH